MRDTHQLFYTTRHRMAIARAHGFGQASIDITEDAPRQPAGIGLAVFPNVFQNIGHLQALTKTYR